MTLNTKDRYLEQIKTGRIFIWTKRLAMRNDMREFEPDLESKGTIIKNKLETDQRVIDLQNQVEALTAELGNKSEVEPVILGELEPELVLDNGKVTREFLETKEKEELRDYALNVYGEKLNHLKKHETLVNDILDLQKKADLSEE